MLPAHMVQHWKPFLAIISKQKRQHTPVILDTQSLRIKEFLLRFGIKNP